MNEQSNDPLAQLAAMKTIADALTPLGIEARNHVLDWAAKNFVPVLSEKAAPPTQARPPKVDNETTTTSTNHFSNLAEFYAASNPQSEPEKVAVVAYWFQVRESNPDLDSQRINKELKHLGHGVSNVTAAFSSLMSRKPQLVIQTRKSGTTQQARKRYMLTAEGKKFVEGMLTPNQ